MATCPVLLPKPGAKDKSISNRIECGRRTEVEVTSACVHEHLVVREMCGRCFDLIWGVGTVRCHQCLLAGFKTDARPLNIRSVNL